MRPNAWFQSVTGSPERYPLNDVVYRDPDGNLLEVVHDLEALKARSPAAWMRTFDERYGRTTWPYGSGVWSKHEWVQPHVAPENVVSLYEGNTNLLWAERYGKEHLGLSDVWVKQAGISHTGSFKDLGMTVLVSSVKQMRSEGVPIRAMACASTGDTSAALAAYGAAADIPVIVLLPKDKITAAQLVQPIAKGAMVVSLDTDFDGCMRVVQERTKDPSIYLANSMNSLRVEGQKTISMEIVQQFDWAVPDWVIVPGGNLGNVSAIAKGFLEMYEVGLIRKLPRVVVAQAERANPLYRAFQKAQSAGRDLMESDFEPMMAGETLASAIRIGAPVSLPKAVKALVQMRGVVEQASEQELAEAAARADKTGMFNCPHTGVALAALEKLAAAGTIKDGERVVVISTAHGLKFSDFKLAYHRSELDFDSTLANKPIEMGFEPSEVIASIHRALDARGH